MMMVQTSIGMILRLRELGESDLLVDLYTGRRGRITAIAKGARRSQKRFFGLLLAGHLIEAQIIKGKSGDLWRLDSAKIVHNYQELREIWSRWTFAAPILELLLRITAPHDPTEGLLTLADGTLQRLCVVREQRLMASNLLIFMINLADKLGFGLCLDVCIKCGQKAHGQKTVYLSHEGGLICSRCNQEDSYQVPQGLVKGMSAAMEMPPEMRNRLAFPMSVCVQGISFMTNYLQAICGRDIQALRVLFDILPKPSPASI